MVNNHPMDPDQIVNQICSFLDTIGITHEERQIEGQTFLPGLEIRNGTVLVDRSKLTYPGDLLHEAGHIALTKPDLRAAISQEALAAQNTAQSEEMGVILWTYLVAKEIGLPPEVIFHAGGYKNESNWLLEQFESGTFIGLPLLVWMGVTEPAKPGETPKVKSWLRVSGE